MKGLLIVLAALGVLALAAGIASAVLEDREEREHRHDL